MQLIKLYILQCSPVSRPNRDDVGSRGKIMPDFKTFVRHTNCSRSAKHCRPSDRRRDRFKASGRTVHALSQIG